MKVPKGGDHLRHCPKQIKQREVHVIWGQLKLQRRTAAAIVEQFEHDPVQESFAILGHAKIQVKVVRI
jgi:predicted CoA-binding protein